MKISVAIPTFNRSQFLKKTLSSILNQSASVDEIVVVDDGSTDDTESVVKRISENVKYIKIENSGPAIARKIAIENSSNPWIALCDSDDVWMRDHIKEFKIALTNCGNMNVYFSNFYQSNAIDFDKFDTAPPNWWDDFTTRSCEYGFLRMFNSQAYVALLSFQPIFQSALVFSRKLYDDVGGIKDDLGRINSEDAHLTRRLAAYGVVCANTNRNVEILKHANNYSTDVVKNMEGRLQILERLVERKEIPEEDISWTKKEIDSSIGELFNQLYWHAKYKTLANTYKKYKRKHHFTAKQKMQYLLSKFK